MKLYGEPGWGSALIEAQLDWYQLDYEFEAVGNLFKSGHARDRLAEINPIAQVPALVMDDGSIMTESAAITLLLAEQQNEESLVPAAGSPERAAFLRWLVFIVANIYPTYTYADEPSRFVSARDARQDYRNTVLDWGKSMYRVLEEAAGQPWFLGERFCAIDIYVCLMTRWEPGRKWFEAHAPKLFSIALATEQKDRLRNTWKRNFPHPS